MVARAFDQTIGIDYSGAGTPTERLPGLAVYRARHNEPPAIVCPQEAGAQNPNVRNWTRRQITQWLVAQLTENNYRTRTLVGIDHAFSFPVSYFQRYNLPPNWDYFLKDFQFYWRTDRDEAYMSCKQCNRSAKRSSAKCIRCNNGRARQGNATWRRLTDQCSGTAKSVFQFGVEGSVAHETHAGLPWLRYIRKELGNRVHFWPFDGWRIPKGKSVIAEVYPSLWRERFRRDADMNDNQHDAYSIAGWLSHADRNGWLADYLNPNLSPAERDKANTEGWIVGVPGFIDLDQE